MATIEENVRELQAKLEEAEKQLLEKQERETRAREKSWEYNIDTIQGNIKVATARQQSLATRLAKGEIDAMTYKMAMETLK